MDRKKALAWAGATSATALSGVLAAGALFGFPGHEDQSPTPKAVAEPPAVVETETRYVDPPPAQPNPMASQWAVTAESGPVTAGGARPVEVGAETRSTGKPVSTRSTGGQAVSDDSKAEEAKEKHAGRQRGGRR